MSPWIPILVALIGGGAAGAVLNHFFTNRRNKRQPVGYTKEVISIFRKNRNFPRLAKLIVTEHPLGMGKEEEVDNLSLARVTVTNKGNQDIEKFVFGITLEGTSKAVDVRMKEPDRHHVMKVSLPTESDKPVRNLDFSLEPFNRNETYGVDIYFTFKKSAGAIVLSSPHSTVFTKITPTKSTERVVLAMSTASYRFLVGIILTLFAAWTAASWETIVAPIKMLIQKLTGK